MGQIVSAKCSHQRRLQASPNFAKQRRVRAWQRHSGGGEVEWRLQRLRVDRVSERAHHETEETKLLRHKRLAFSTAAGTNSQSGERRAIGAQFTWYLDEKWAQNFSISSKFLVAGEERC